MKISAFQFKRVHPVGQVPCFSFGLFRKLPNVCSRFGFGMSIARQPVLQRLGEERKACQLLPKAVMKIRHHSLLFPLARFQDLSFQKDLCELVEGVDLTLQNLPCLLHTGDNDAPDFIVDRQMMEITLR